VDTSWPEASPLPVTVNEWNREKIASSLDVRRCQCGGGGVGGCGGLVERYASREQLFAMRTFNDTALHLGNILQQ
jgi:hypothetical protein